MSEPRRTGSVSVSWYQDVGRLTIDNQLWAAVEWSEKRQVWCIENAAGECLTHLCSLQGTAPDKNAAVMLAEAMIRDGRMPSPEEAHQLRRKAQQAAREKRERQPSYQRRKQERAARIELMRADWEARREEDAEAPIYEVLAEVFDFTDPDLWKSNAFASLRPRLTIHVRAAVAKLESELAQTAYAWTGVPREKACSAVQHKLDQAREILALLDPKGRVAP